MALGALGQRALGLRRGAATTACSSRLDLARARRARRAHPLLGLAPAPARRARSAVARELQPRLQHLALEALVQLGRFGLALERAQARARLALDVERAVEVLLRALELQLRAAAALAVLAEPRRLLDQQAPLARLGGDDRLDPALGDDRVGLLAEARVGEHLDHVAEPAAGAVQPVAALAVAVEPPHDRDLAERQVDRAVGVVEHDLDLGELRACTPRPPPKITSCIDWPAHGERRLLAHRPQDGVGDVGLARAVRPHDDAHARPEVQARAVGEGLEALQRERLQAHADPRSAPLLRCELLDRLARRLLLGVLLAAPAAAAHLARRRPARPPCRCARAAGRPRPSPRSRPSSPRRASSSCSADLKSTGCSSASSISGANASTTASAVRS